MTRRSNAMVLVGLALILFVPFLLAQSTTTGEKPKEKTEDEEEQYRCTANIDTLIFQLREQDAGLRWLAADCLAELKDARAVQPLVDALYSEKYPRLALVEARALKSINDPHATVLLLQGLKDSRNRPRAIEALGRLGAPEAVEPFINILRLSKNEDDRQWVVMAMGEINDPRVLGPLEEALKDKDIVLRRYAASSLGYLGNIDAVDSLVASLRDPDDAVRWNAAVALGKLKSSKAVSSLGRAINDKKEETLVKTAAADSLGQIGDASAIPLLAAAFRGADAEVRWHVAAALANYDSPDVEQLLNNSLRQGEYGIVAAAHKYFIHKNDELSISTLIAAIQEHGYYEMAQDFIDSGDPRLVHAGQEWMKRSESEGVSLQ